MQISNEYSWQSDVRESRLLICANWLRICLIRTDSLRTLKIIIRKYIRRRRVLLLSNLIHALQIAGAL